LSKKVAKVTISVDSQVHARRALRTIFDWNRYGVGSNMTYELFVDLFNH